MPTVRELVKADLPNFPDDVVENWVLGHCSSWPPPIESNWGPKFLCKSKEFWQNTQWNLVDFDIDNFSFSDHPDNPIYAIAGAFGYDVEDPLTIFTEITGERYVRILSHLLNFGSFPKPVCLLLKEGEYTIADGHHRIYALRVARAIHNKLSERDEAYRASFECLLREAWQVENIVPPALIQKVWIAQYS